MWQLTAENCHQIYSRLCGLKINAFSSGAGATGDTSPVDSHLTVIELHPRHNNPDEESDFCGTDGIAFFGSIPQILSNINSLLRVEEATAETGAPNHERNNEKRKNKSVFEEKEGGNSFFIDVSPSSTLPRIMQDEEEAVLARKCLLLHIRDYLQANIGASTLNANDCLSTFLPPACTPIDDPWDLCFLSGVLLGYPLIYCNSTPQEGNCLAHQPLTNYTVTLDGEQHFPVYSFSVPEAFHAQTSRRVNDWFEGLCERVLSKHLRLQQSVETHALILT